MFFSGKQRLVSNRLRETEQEETLDTEKGNNKHNNNNEHKTLWLEETKLTKSYRRHDQFFHMNHKGTMTPRTFRVIIVTSCW